MKLIKIIPFNCPSSEHDYLRQFFKLREQVFVSGYQWDLDTIRGEEIDQYDMYTAVYVLAIDTDTDEVIGGGRLLPTTHEAYPNAISIDPVSYMIRDAYLGRLESLPSDICFTAPPVDATIWEFTRFVVTQGKIVAPLILKEANNYLLSRGAKRCLFLGPTAFLRFARAMYVEAKPIGRVFKQDRQTCVAFSCDINDEFDGDPIDQAQATLVAELWNNDQSKVGSVYRWETGQEQVSWIDRTLMEQDPDRFRRVAVF